MDIIQIEGLETDAVIGVHAWERTVRQPLLFDLTVEFDNRAPAASDDLARTVDYAEICNEVRSFGAGLFVWPAVDEVIGFCEYLERRQQEDLRVPCLADVVSLERTMLDLQRPSPRRGRVTRQIHLQHDAVELLGPLAAGRVPENVRDNPCVILATVEDDGSLSWAPPSPALAV